MVPNFVTGLSDTFCKFYNSNDKTAKTILKVSTVIGIGAIAYKNLR
jgi:hypothetical protein